MESLLLLSGGLDSTVLLGYLLSLGKKCLALSFDYGQRHKRELESAALVATHYNASHFTLRIDPLLFSSASSSLTNTLLHVTSDNIYVPARNLLFLAHATSFAESRNVTEIYLGTNATDSPLFPDCKRPFFDALEATIHLGTENKNPISIHTPFSCFSKKEIVALGRRLAVPMELSFSCYDPKGNTPCGSCQACIFREKAG